MANHDQCPPGQPGYPSDCEVTQGLRQRSQARQADDERGYVWRSCFPRAKAIKLLLLDVDGVLTDGTITYTHEGTEIKSFNTRDGLGVRLLQQAGVEVGLITARSSEAVTRRARDLKLRYVFQQVSDKVAVYEQVRQELGLEPHNVAYVGDDWLDIPLLTRVGFAATVADAEIEVRKLVHYVARRAGGRGAVREICTLILDAQDAHAGLLQDYLNR